jgi:hypothetical protein
MRFIWPEDTARLVSDDDLEELYQYPADPKWLAVNYVSSADGAVEIEGRSTGLSNPAARRVYQLGSDLADVVLLGAGTATLEVIRGGDPDAKNPERRRRQRLPRRGRHRHPGPGRDADRDRPPAGA